MMISYTRQMTPETLDEHYLRLAISLACQSTPIESGYCVGAVLVNPDGVLSTGYSRELPGNTHAEEVCFMKLVHRNEEVFMDNVTLYTTMEPCGQRLSGKQSCVDWILNSKLQRIVMGIHEPSLFVKGTGVHVLTQAGIGIIRYPEFDAACWAPNRHLDAKLKALNEVET
ncbi:DRAP deaminase [Coelomomyces lativittatus]|nr:DRAP deaminase [Coelomomyces lativittatus]KAJ1500193.1 DRAP deaminase [Coelomomyces lativittatus]KAJ1518743.1 DRAP deaminase [Coelomomyces lativittatus]